MRGLSSVSVLMVLYMVSGVYGQISSTFKSDTAEFCCNVSPGPQVQTLPGTLEEIANSSPKYEQVVSNSYYTQQLDNVCHTYYECDNGTYVRFTGLRYADGSTVLERFLVSEVPNYQGVHRVVGLAQESGSSTIIYDEVAIGSSCPDIDVYYRKIIAGRCDVLEYATLGANDYVHGDSSLRDVSDSCKCQVASVASSQPVTFKGTRFEYLPNKQDRFCVTQWNGVSCINAYRVLPQDSYSLSSSGYERTS